MLFQQKQQTWLTAWFRERERGKEREMRSYLQAAIIRRESQCFTLSSVFSTDRLNIP